VAQCLDGHLAYARELADLEHVNPLPCAGKQDNVSPNGRVKREVWLFAWGHRKTCSVTGISLIPYPKSHSSRS
jgi:hypothetical protein